MDRGIGPKRTLRPDANTSLSGVAVLYLDHRDNRLSMVVYHNVYAKHPFEPNWLRRSSVRHFALSDKVKGHFQEWAEV
jgi:hypothetical protein